MLEIQDSTPDLISLIADPKRELWSFYKYLTCSTYFIDGKIITILVIPLVRLDRKFEVYKAIAVPTLSQKTIINPENQYTNLIAQYHLDGAGFLIDKSRTQYQLLTMAELSSCCRASVRFCTVRNPVFPVALTKSCMTELFMSRENDDVTSCVTQISNQMLPTAIYLFDINWAVIAREDLTFALVCNSRVHGEKKTKSPVSIIQVKDGCTASNKHFALSSSYIMGKSISTNARLILQAANFSKSAVWNPFEEKFSNYTTLKLPEHLSAVKDMTLSELMLC